MIRSWNRLDARIRTSPTIATFKQRLQQQMFHTRPEHLSKVRGKSSIAHTRLRLGLSPLKQHLHSHGIILSPICQQCRLDVEETAVHYLLLCPKYAVQRQDLLSFLRPVAGGLNININNTHIATELLLHGSINLSTELNITLFNNVQAFITSTKRF